MNNVLLLRGNRFLQAKKKSGAGGVSFNGKNSISQDHLNKLLKKLTEIETFWQNESRPFSGIIISVYYNKIVAKSNRISGLFKGQYSNDAVVGAKFNKDKSKHIITYYLDSWDLKKSIMDLSSALSIMKNNSLDKIDKKTFDNKTIFNKIKYDKYSIKKTAFRQILADTSYIDDFNVEQSELNCQSAIITLYDTKNDTQELLKKLGIDVLNTRILDNRTVILDERQRDSLFARAPYLVAMASEDLLELNPEDFNKNFLETPRVIPDPGIEPTIGVIDALFDDSVYFHEWVEYHDMVDPNISRTGNDYRHGTAVDSIIVDGPSLNPWLDDECGRFKVRHFGVACGKHFSAVTTIKKIKQIISENSDIKVWNLSLGSNYEINDNFISAEAYVLDQIQFEYDVIFVIAGTNKPNDDIVKIGSPADSINSMVVNAVSSNGLSTNYSRKGLALSFFAKPDVSYYGGSREKYMRVREPLEEAEVAGTSFAAPWIARKLSYLIDVLGLNREVAKALIIDSARKWNEKPSPEEVALYGHGVVPIRISEIIQSKDDEIKFVVSDVSEKWNTYNYHFPVPLNNSEYPFVAKATMCYFTKCDRSQGVDYTNTELNIHFGRIKNNGKISDIKGDTQNQELPVEESTFLLEGEARERFRKWDNVKYVTEDPRGNKRPRKSYNNKNWGMEIKTNNRLDPHDGEGIHFGVVVTLKEINGINRIDDFIKNCSLNGWYIEALDVKTKVALRTIANETVDLN